MTDRIRAEITNEYINTRRMDREGIEEFFKDVLKLMVDAEDAGFTNVRVHFESTMEPYEDFIGDPMLVVTGDRLKTEEELKGQKESEEIMSLAREKGISQYEAGVLLNLMKRGKL